MSNTIKMVRKVTYFFVILTSAFILTFITGCTSVERRSEAIPKKPLPKEVKHVQLKTKWKTSTGSGVGGKLNTNVVLAKHKNVLYTADYKGNITAVNKNNGKKIWKVKIKEKITAGPATDGDKVIVACGEDSIVAINAQNGEKLWTKNIGSEVLAVPTIKEGYVYIHSLDGRILAINKDTGNKFWEYSYSLPKLILRKFSKPLATSNNVYVGLSNGKLASLDRSNGQLEWVIDISQNIGRTDLKRMSDIASIPVLDFSDIYVVSYQGKLAKISSYTGQTVWDTKASSYSGICVDSSRVYVSDELGHVIAFDKDSGGKIWHLNLLEGRTLSRPIIFNDNLVVGDKDGNVHFISAEDGKYINRYKLGNNGMYASPIVENENLYILGRGGNIVALKAF